MREMMQKALSALGQRKHSEHARQAEPATAAKRQAETSEDWGMTPEEALRASTSMVSGYK